MALVSWTALNSLCNYLIVFGDTFLARAPGSTGVTMQIHTLSESGNIRENSGLNTSRMSFAVLIQPCCGAYSIEAGNAQACYLGTGKLAQIRDWQTGK